jgi:hypothetical protein
MTAAEIAVPSTTKSATKPGDCTNESSEPPAAFKGGGRAVSVGDKVVRHTTSVKSEQGLA